MQHYTLDFDQLHLDIDGCSFNAKCKRIIDKFEVNFLDSEVGKSLCELGSKYTPQIVHLEREW